MWKYIQTDNFFDNTDYNILLNEVNKINAENIKSNEIKITSNKIYKDGKIENECLSTSLLQEFNKKYHHKMIKYLENLYPQKVPLYDYSDFHIVITGKDYFFPIHNDNVNKLLSVVIYLDPRENFGTFLYSSKRGKNKKKIEWRKNRALIFARKQGVTWHSYGSNGKENRVTLVYNLCTNDEDAVRRIEYGKFIFSIYCVARYLKSKFF